MARQPACGTSTGSRSGASCCSTRWSATGTFDKLRRWLISQGTQDIRVQTILFAWAFGALLEGLVGFGYPWAFVAPILIALGIPDLDAIRVAAIANNAPVSYGALGAPIIALAAVTGYPLLALSGSISKIVAILAILPPWILLYLVSGKKGMWGAWPLAIVGSLGYIAGQLPVGTYLGPYLPDVAGSIVCFVCLLLLLKVWRPAQVLGYGGKPIERRGLASGGAWAFRRRHLPGMVANRRSDHRCRCLDWAVVEAARHCDAASPGDSGFLDRARRDDREPFSTGRRSSAARLSWRRGSSLHCCCGVNGQQLGEIWKKTWSQMWGACLVGVFIFGLAYVYNFSGMAASLAKAFSSLGAAFIIVAPILGFIGVALSGSNTSTNAMFGKFQALVGQILGFPPLLLPTLNSIGSEIGKPIAPQTASVGVSTSRFVRDEGAVIRHNFGWCLVLLGYLIVISVACYLFFPGIMKI